MSRNRSRLLALTALLIPFSVPALAEVSTTEPGAIIVFPRIESSEDADTVIQLTNNAGTRVYARCFYVDGRDGREDPQPVWAVTDFQTTLTRQQPTVWVAGTGLPAVPIDRPDDLYPGPIPPVANGFVGELRCIVVDESERPIGRNALTGEATIVQRSSGVARKYQGITFKGSASNNGDNTLLLNDDEYSSCPRLVFVNHFFDDAPDPVVSTPITSRLTIIPCSMNIESSIPGDAALVFDVFNEFEQRLSRNLAVTCFHETFLSRIDSSSQPSLSIFNYALQGTLVGLSRIRPVVDSGDARGHGVLAIMEEFRGDSADALNLHFIGGQLQADVIALPDPF